MKKSDNLRGGDFLTHTVFVCRHTPMSIPVKFEGLCEKVMEIDAII